MGPKAWLLGRQWAGWLRGASDNLYRSVPADQIDIGR